MLCHIFVVSILYLNNMIRNMAVMFLLGKVKPLQFDGAVGKSPGESVTTEDM